MKEWCFAHPIMTFVIICLLLGVIEEVIKDIIGIFRRVK